MKTIAEKIIAFNKQLHFSESLPGAFSVLNPFRENPETLKVMSTFYHQFYDDYKERKFIIGINPGRHGAGITGVPFTDTKRLESACGITMQSKSSYEPSSVFIYDMIEAYGGVKNFYATFYINSPFPLAIIKNDGNGKHVNANYYDDKSLFDAVKPFITKTLRQHVAIGLNTEKAYVLGKKNAIFINAINEKEKLFDELIVLEHPRFIQQYKSKEKQSYIDQYVIALTDR